MQASYELAQARRVRATGEAERGDAVGVRGPDGLKWQNFFGATRPKSKGYYGSVRRSTPPLFPLPPPGPRPGLRCGSVRGADDEHRVRRRGLWPEPTGEPRGDPPAGAGTSMSSQPSWRPPALAQRLHDSLLGRETGCITLIGCPPPPLAVGLLLRGEHTIPKTPSAARVGHRSPNPFDFRQVGADGDDHGTRPGLTRAARLAGAHVARRCLSAQQGFAPLHPQVLFADRMIDEIPRQQLLGVVAAMDEEIGAGATAPRRRIWPPARRC